VFFFLLIFSVRGKEEFGSFGLRVLIRLGVPDTAGNRLATEIRQAISAFPNFLKRPVDTSGL
jgi:hypothetical protein